MVKIQTSSRHHLGISQLKEAITQAKQLVQAQQFAAAVYATMSITKELFFYGLLCGPTKRSEVYHEYEVMVSGISQLWIPVVDSCAIEKGLGEKLFESLISELRKYVKVGNDDFYYYPHDLCKRLGLQLDKVERFISYLKIARRHSGEVTAEHYAEEIFELLYSSGRKEKAMKFVEKESRKNDKLAVHAARVLLKDHMELTLARELIIPHYEKSFLEKKMNFFGTRLSWQSLAMVLFQAEGDSEALKQCLIDVLLQPEALFIQEHVGELRKLTSDDEWRKLYPKLEKSAREEAEWFYDDRFPEGLADLYLIAEDKEKLMQLLRKHAEPDFMRYIDYLLPEYKTELVDVFSDYVDTKINTKQYLGGVKHEIQGIVPKLPHLIDRVNELFVPLGERIVWKDKKASFEALQF